MHKIIQYDINDVAEVLLNQKTPIMEATLIRQLSDNYGYSKTSDNIYTVHFSLYHCLYKLKNLYGRKNYYLHLDPMRIRLLKINNTCNHYNEDTGKFCKERKVSKFYCEKHIDETGDYDLSFDILYEFYINKNNINFGSDIVLEKLYRGYSLYCLKPGIVKDALKYFSIDKPDKKIIKKRYHLMAKKFHPDISNYGPEKMKELNYYYKVLSDICVL